MFKVFASVLCVQSCSSVMFFEVRKKMDLYIWMAKSPDGPSVKFHVANGEWQARNWLTV